MDKYQVWLWLNGRKAFVFTTYADSPAEAESLAINATREQRVAKCWLYQFGDVLTVEPCPY